MNTTYSSNDVKALGDLEAIRARPGMYIGDTTHPGHLFNEALDNSLDEVQAGHSHKVTVSVDTTTNTYTIRDYGRGIPIGKTSYVDILGTEHSIETLQLLFTKNHSGGKFGGDSYKVSRGLHGVGNKCINALSEHMRVVTTREGKSVELVTSRGELLELNYHDTEEPNGVEISFKPDSRIFSTAVIPREHLETVSGISKAFGMEVEVFIDGELIELPYNTLYDLLPPNDGSNSLLKTTFEVASGEGGFTVAIEYTSATNTLYRGYTNMIPNPGGGSHVRFFEDCYKEAWLKYSTPDFRPSDVLVGLRALTAVFLINEAMSFAGQTKERLTTNKSYFEIFKTELILSIQNYFDSNPELVKGLVKRFEEYRASQNKLLANKELSSLIVVNNDDTSKGVRRKSVVSKLRECTSKSREDTELYITEGDSAAGSMVSARDIKTQAILPIRGKILNVSRRPSYVECLKNEEVRSIINSIGAGIGTDSDATKSRYERVLITCDADEDGKNIAALLISLFVNLLPDLVNAGMVYVIEPPLYGWFNKKTKSYEFSDAIDEVPQNTEFTRYKGLGEMDAIEIKESLMCRTNQRLIQIDMPDNLDDFNEAMTSSSLRFKLLEEAGVISREGI